MQASRSTILPYALIPLALSVLPAACAHAQIGDLEATYRFLVSDRETQGGALYTATAGALKGSALPLSFYDTPQYWGEQVCAAAKGACIVKDIYNSADYTLTPPRGPAGDLQTERVNVHNGANIYDAATWQIAVVLGQVVNKFGNPVKQDAYALATNQNKLLKEGYSGNARSTVPPTNRAMTKGNVFLYNGQVVSNADRAYSFRMLARNWLATDPLAGSRYASWITVNTLPIGNSEYQVGKVSWTDWKAITGENAWAFLVGPLQAAYIHYVQEQQLKFVPFADLAIRNALAVLPTFAAMQSPIGGVYHVPSGTLDNQGIKLINPHEIAVENNFSLYAGLRILEATLRAEIANDTSLAPADKATISTALKTINVMINGGQVGNNTATEGLLAFFKTKAWRNNEFVQGGLANDPNERSTWVPTLAPKAVDANTWGVAALGARQIDVWFGFGAAYKLWQQVQGWGAYGDKTELWGVGYSDQDGNGRDREGIYRQGVMSAEWTAGAIDMVRNMIHYYESIPGASASHAAAQSYLKNLKDDESAMLEAIQTLRFDSYQKTSFPGKPNDYPNLISQTSQPYLYASRRYFIPFGWYANPLPSTCSTAWIIMIADHYDPFGYGGKTN